MEIRRSQPNKNSPSESRYKTRSHRGFALLLHSLRQLLHELLAVLIPQQVLDGLLLQTGKLLHGDAQQLANRVIPDHKACPFQRPQFDVVHLILGNALACTGFRLPRRSCRACRNLQDSFLARKPRNHTRLDSEKVRVHEFVAGLGHQCRPHQL